MTIAKRSCIATLITITSVFLPAPLLADSVIENGSLPFYPKLDEQGNVYSRFPNFVKETWDDLVYRSGKKIGRQIEKDEIKLKVSKNCNWMPRYIWSEKTVQYGTTSMIPAMYTQVVLSHYLFFEYDTENFDYLDLIFKNVHPKIEYEYDRCINSFAGQSSTVLSEMPTFENLGLSVPSESEFLFFMADVLGDPLKKQIMSNLGIGSLKFALAHELAHHILHREEVCCTIEQEIEADEFALSILHDSSQLVTLSLGHMLLMWNWRGQENLDIPCRVSKVLAAEGRLLPDFGRFGRDPNLLRKLRQLHQTIGLQASILCLANDGIKIEN